jgi:hypothetical protein
MFDACRSGSIFAGVAGSLVFRNQWGDFILDLSKSPVGVVEERTELLAKAEDADSAALQDGLSIPVLGSISSAVDKKLF